MRRLGEPVLRNIRYRTRPGAYALLVRDGNALLTVQHEPLTEIQLPGGGIDPGESPVRALHREVMEETGWRIDTPRRLGIYRRFAYSPDDDAWYEKICHMYLARPISRLSEPTEPFHTAFWSPIGAVLDLLDSPADREYLADLLP